MTEQEIHRRRQLETVASNLAQAGAASMAGGAIVILVDRVSGGAGSIVAVATAGFSNEISANILLQEVARENDKRIAHLLMSGKDNPQ